MRWLTLDPKVNRSYKLNNEITLKLNSVYSYHSAFSPNLSIYVLSLSVCVTLFVCRVVLRCGDQHHHTKYITEQKITQSVED